MTSIILVSDAERHRAVGSWTLASRLRELQHLDAYLSMSPTLTKSMGAGLEGFAPPHAERPLPARLDDHLLAERHLPELHLDDLCYLYAGAETYCVRCVVVWC